MKVVTRFAPSPTGYLHIGGARTALFNYLFAKKHNGKFLLRIEDTDKERSNSSALEAIFSGLKWLGLNWDDEVVYQSERTQEHNKAAQKLLNNGRAYYCFCSQEEIESARASAIANKEHFIFNSPWREANPDTYPQDIKPVIRFKAPRAGFTIIHDQLQGEIEVANNHIDDMVLVRSNGSPTYMLAVVVDDHDMGITHIIRGDDHLANAARQIAIYQALEYAVPMMVHIPLIHGQDGAKLSKRHGALGIDAYKDMGLLPDALCNYLLRLGWAHGDDEIITKAQAIEWFDIEGLGKSPARLDMDKMKYLNAVYLRNMNNSSLTKIAIEILEKSGLEKEGLRSIVHNNIYKAMDSIKTRAEFTYDLANFAKLYLPWLQTFKDTGIDFTDDDREIIIITKTALEKWDNFDKDSVQTLLKNLATEKGVKIGEFMRPIRLLITGMANSPSVFEIISIIGKDETIFRLS